MNFKGRYSLITGSVIVVFCIVFFIPFDSQNHKCPQCLDCSSLLKDIKAFPSFQNDLVVIRKDKIGNKTFDELKLEKIKDMINEQKSIRNSNSQRQVSEKVHKYSSPIVMDCLSWEKIKDSSALQNNIASNNFIDTSYNHKNNITLNVTQLLKNKTVHVLGTKNTLTPELYLLLVGSLNTILLQSKPFLQKERIAVLDLYCGDIDWIKYLLFTRRDIEYTCIDTDQHSIHRNKITYQNLPHVQFISFDVLRKPWTEMYDLVLANGMLDLLEPPMIQLLLQHIAQNSRNILVSTSNLTIPDAFSRVAAKHDVVVKEFGEPICRSATDSSLDVIITAFMKGL